ncbi:MAG: hypothetical protein AABZ06_06340 [Bdellovibrionota bacterium]
MGTELPSHPPTFLKLLTTTNNKLDGLLQNGETLPAWLLKWASNKFPHITKATELNWDDLTPEMQIMLLREISKQRKQNFLIDRQIHGIVARKKVKLIFTKPTIFMGNEYKPGAHEVDVSKFLGNVEYSGLNAVENVIGVELHFRANKPAGELSNDAWVLLKGLGIPRNHQHIHIVAPLPVEWLRAEPELRAAIIADFFRRANLAAEAITIVQDGNSIKTREGPDGIRYFGSLMPYILSNVTRYFLNIGRGVILNKHDGYVKIAWVGMRGHDTYDSPNLWGTEFRSISRRSDPALVKNVLNALQYAMVRNEFGVPKEQMEAWIKSRSTGSITDVPRLLGDAWYNKDWVQLWDKTPNHPELAFNKLKKSGENHTELKMLIHDWSKDPLFFNDPVIQKMIAIEQNRALTRLNETDPKITDLDTHINTIMRDFLLDSGIYEKVLRSLGVKLEK